MKQKPNETELNITVAEQPREGMASHRRETEVVQEVDEGLVNARKLAEARIQGRAA